MNFYPPFIRIAGRYEVASRPLLGGMGVVYLCYDHQEQRPVALKTFRPEYLPDRATRDRFLREGATWVNLGKHPHIVRAYGVERIGDGREVYLVLELVTKEEGRQDASLRSWLTPGKPLAVDQALLFALQIARAMKHAAAMIPGFVHRDLKPENVLVGADRLAGWAANRVRVTDFGLAAVMESVTLPASGDAQSADVRRTQLTRGAVGTPLYMAPEQWAGEPVSEQTDMYALGCILFEMLNGEQAVDGCSLKDLERAHRDGAVRPWRADVPPAARAVASRCLGRRSRERYGNWGVVEQALSASYAELTGRAAPAPEAPQGLDRSERVALGWAQSAMGLSYMDIGKADVARGYFERARDAGAAEGERRLESAALGNLGLAYAALGDARQAIGYFEQCLNIHREIGDRRGEGQTLGNLGLAYAALGDARQAIGYVEQDLAIAREIGDRRGEGVDLGNLGLAYAALGDARRAIGYYEQALAIDREVGDRREEGNALGNLGEAYQLLGDARRAIGYFEQHLAIAREMGDRRGEGNALGNLGNAYYSLGETRRAIEFYGQHLLIAREIGDRRGEGIALGNLGLAYADLGDARRAIGYYEQALAIAREIGDRRGEGYALGNLGEAYRILGDARRAIEYYEQALAITREIGDRHGEGTVLGNLGIAYKNMGDARRAIGYYEQDLAIAREIGDVSGMATVSFNMALLYQQQGDPACALPLAQDAARIWAQIGSPSAQRAQQFVAQLQGGA